MELASLHENEWEYVRTLLPEDLEESGYRSSALLRCRNIPNAVSLMRIALAYAVSDLSLKDVAAWASALQLAEITGPGLFYRLRQAEEWLEQVLGRVLSDQVPQTAGGLRLRVVDATGRNGPGQKAVQWRAHVSINPSTGSIRAVELTDDSGGEKFSRHQFRTGEVVLGDRGYATARGVYAARQQEAHVVVRFNPATLRTCDEKRRRIYLGEREAEIPKVGAVEFQIKIPVPPPPTRSHKTWDSAKAIAWIPARAIAARTRTGEVTWILTTLPRPQMPAIGILGLYRVRWQIGVSSQGHIVQSVRDRPGRKDSGPVAGEAPWRESKTAEPSDNILRKECAQRTRLQRTVNADVASLHENPVAETVDNARKQQELTEMSPARRFSPAGYQRRHGVKDDVETGEALGARRRKLVEEMPVITVSGKCWHRHQGDGSGRITGDGRAAKRVRREGPGPVSIPLVQSEAGVR